MSAQPGGSTGSSSVSPPTTTGVASATGQAVSALAEEQWAAVLRTAHAVPPAPPLLAFESPAPQTRTRSAGPDPAVARAVQLRTLAQQARDFRNRYPTHAQADAARKLAVLADLDAILPTDVTHRRAAEAAATALRRDVKAPWAHRVKAAEALEHRFIRLKLPGHAWTTNPMLAEPMLDRLRQEFGDRPEIWARYLHLAENTNCDAGRDIAYRILQSPIAAPGTKAGAQRILQRYALVRNRIDLPLYPVRGPATQIAAAAGKTTVIVLWDGKRQPAGPPGLGEFVTTPRNDLTWIYISQGLIGTKPPGRPDSKYPPGLICFEGGNGNGPSAQVLKPPQLPYAYVLDAQRRLTGYGRVDEIATLLATMNRPIAP